MPMHDWTRVPAEIYHDFHGSWLYAIRGALNGGALPPGYYALAEQMMRTFGPDVLTLHNPAGNGSHNGSPRELPNSSGGVAVAEAPPRARVEAKEKRVPLPQGQRRLSVRHVSDHRMVAIIELVSPGNKDGVSNFDAFVGKACGVIHAGLHLIVIDPFPPTRRDPNGVHGAIWKELTDKEFVQPTDRPLTIAAYCAGEEVTALVNPLAVGETIPDAPLFLDAERYVQVPLEATYQSAWQTFPAEWRNVVSGGGNG
ncbi:DUF4058 family protein [Gemmata sp. JC673]|uniref:DUF4058 family protein n=1 Tax=Gemmata algarum TaxID=2975278 RepID=A0ABU5F1V8_9BACT|nr:DUF4058 family protein [Gemmata algarum]MDY3561169.1 DUF4058 family protein [Gemmata algarum]